MRLRSGIGMSTADEAAEAGRAAATAAVMELGGEATALIVVYASPSYDLPALLASIRKVTGQTHLVGATTGGHFANGTVHPVGQGVAVLALTAGPYHFGVASVSGISDDLDETGRRLSRESRAAAGATRHGAVLLFTDWLIGDQQQLIQGIYRVTGPRIPTVGGAAADLLTFGPTMVFHDDQVLERGAVTVWIGSEHPLKVVTRHGWEPIGMPMLVGRVDGTDLQELGGQPAAAAYFQQLGLPANSGESREDFWAVGLNHPLAVVQSDGSLLVRAVIGRTPNGTLTTTSQVPVGSVVHVTTGTTDALLDCIEPLVQDVLDDQPEAGVILTFSCVARAQIFGERKLEEPVRLQCSAGDVPTFGFWTFGEYGRTCGVLGTHNATITALAL
jgi:hypothetical protein